MMKGQCLCKKVTLATSETIDTIGACHCNMCNQWGAAPFISVQLHILNIQGETYISKYRSSEWAERGFCSHCGTHLFYHLLSPSIYYVNVALFEHHEPQKSIELEIFTDKKPSYYSFLNSHSKKLTEKEVFELVMNAPQNK